MWFIDAEGRAKYTTAAAGQFGSSGRICDSVSSFSRKIILGFKYSF